MSSTGEVSSFEVEPAERVVADVSIADRVVVCSLDLVLLSTDPPEVVVMTEGVVSEAVVLDAEVVVISLSVQNIDLSFGLVQLHLNLLS